MAAMMPVRQLPDLSRNHISNESSYFKPSHRVKSVLKGFPAKSIMLNTLNAGKFTISGMPTHRGGHLSKRMEARVISPEIFQWSTSAEILDSTNDEYDGVIIDSESLPSNVHAFALALKTSISYWKSKGKKGVWLKIQSEQADFVPVAIQEGFDFHQGEAGYVMLTNWISNEQCLLPSSPSHQIGVGGFVINDKKEVLVVKEKCPCSCSSVWKIPTGYVNKSEDIFCGATREVKEETGVETMFLEIVAFRHAHLLAFEKSDLLFICMLKPLSSEITIDENEIQAAKWMALEEFVAQPFYEEDGMSRKMIEICMAAHEDAYTGFNGRLLSSKLDGKLSYLYYDQTRKV